MRNIQAQTEIGLLRENLQQSGCRNALPLFQILDRCLKRESLEDLVIPDGIRMENNTIRIYGMVQAFELRETPAQFRLIIPDLPEIRGVDR